MATTHLPGTGIGPGDADKHGRRSAVIAAVALACAAIVVPFALHGARHSGAEASPAAPVSQAPPAPALHHHVTHDGALGAQADLPPLLSSGRPALQDGVRVRVGDVTVGTLRRTPHGWQVLVRWDGRLQPLTTQGPVTLGATSWVSASGLLYTRVPTDTPGRFRVYSWDPEGGTAYTAPSLVSSELGPVCFNKTFTAFGDCHAH